MLIKATVRFGLVAEGEDVEMSGVTTDGTKGHWEGQNMLTLGAGIDSSSNWRHLNESSQAQTIKGRNRVTGNSHFPRHRKQVRSRYEVDSLE